uniref:ymf76 n=1 Tax=Cryptocaryon irritans TaxID=153251 RepID=UPI0022FD8753|nr:ymf76 [Cryptocaryon irritans]WBP62312.1 ymf76 [Cryptocaryon irritans]
MFYRNKFSKNRISKKYFYTLKKKKFLIKNKFKCLFKRNKKRFNRYNIWNSYRIRKKFFLYSLENKKLFNFFFFKNKHRKKNLKTFLKKKKHLTPNLFFIKLEMSLIGVLNRTNFFNSLNDIYYFLKNNYIFINGLVVKNPFFQLTVGDRIQLIVFKNYFFFYKTRILLFKKNFLRFKFKLWRMYELKLKVYNTKFSDKLKNLFFYKKKVPNFLEIDFKLLMCVVIYNPSFNYELDLFKVRFLSNYMHRLYLWN